MKKVGFIGCGNMAMAMIRQIIKKGLCEPEDIVASALRWETLEKPTMSWEFPWPMTTALWCGRRISSF